MRAILEELNRIFQEVFEDPTLLVQNHTTAKDIESWDSLMHIQLIVAVERHFGIRFGVGEIEKLQNVGEMISLIVSKLNG